MNFSQSDPLVQTLLSIIRGLVVLVVALLLARYAKQWTVRLFARKRVSLNLATLLGNLAQVIVAAFGIVYTLRSFGIDWAGLLTVVGVGGLAISLSLQDLLKNVVAGIYILMEQPFRIGDRISVKEVTGSVQGIELRTTILCTDDNLQVVVPNNVILNEILTNRSASNLQRQIILLRVERGSVTEMSSEISEILKGFTEVASSPAPVIALEGVQEGVARLRVEFWVHAGVGVNFTPQVVEALQAKYPHADVTVVRTA
jgi:small conductance mechanosensitive channel